MGHTFTMAITNHTLAANDSSAYLLEADTHSPLIGTDIQLNVGIIYLLSFVQDLNYHSHYLSFSYIYRLNLLR
jgi:hypothetical protein